MERKNIRRAILLTATLYVFLLSIKLIGTSFKLFGTTFAEQLISFTANPFVGLFIGILATSIVQSSSITTSILVGLTAAGALTIGNAIPIIMGANIGTSVTNTIVSLGHIAQKEEFRKAFEAATVHDLFNIVVVIIMFPLEMYFHILEESALFLTNFLLGPSMNVQFSSPLNYILNPVAHSIQYISWNNASIVLVLSMVMLFASLRSFVRIMRPLAQSEFKQLLHRHMFKTPAQSFSFGLILTAVIQSSSISTYLIVPLAGVGILSLERIFPYILGANIGTTFTALMASLVTGSPAAITVALEHVLFNTIGSAIICPIRWIPIGLSKWLAYLSFESRIYSFVYLASVFYILPSFVIFLFH